MLQTSFRASGLAHFLRAARWDAEEASETGLLAVGTQGYGRGS